MDNELYITDLIDINILQRIQDAFSEMTGMAALTTDHNGVAVTNGSNFSDFCIKYTRMSNLGCLRCEESDKIGADSSLKTGKPCSYYCHAGLVDFAAPIMAGGKKLGGFIGGQVLTSPPDFEKFRETALELGLDPDEYVTAAKHIKVIDKKNVDKAANFLFVIANVLSDMAFKSYCLHISNLEIEKNSHLKSDFLANMSHEIRTPMNAVLGMAELALREEMSPVAKGYMHQIKASSKNLLVIINDILDFSKIESGKMDIIEVAYEPLSLINDLANIVNSRIGNKSVEFTLDISPDMPQNLFGDNIRIHQIILNILTNAIKFTQQGEVHLSFKCECESNDTAVLKVAISDTGRGIKKENLGKLFHSFQQIDSKRNRNIEGTGLGLAITQQLLYLMNGKISVDSTYGKGSTFFFELPQKIINDTPAIQKTDKNLEAAVLVDNVYVKKQLLKDLERIGVKYIELDSEGSLEGLKTDFFIFEKKFYMQTLQDFFQENPDMQGIVITSYDSKVNTNFQNIKVVHKPVYSLSLYNAMGISNVEIHETSNENEHFTFVAPDAHVLIVDDNSINLTVASGILEPLNMCIDVAISAVQAIDKVTKFNYDLIFMDHMMPEVDGVEATHIIRRMLPNYNDIPIIALTANAVAGAKEMFIKEGMNDFVAKPIEIKDIVSKLRKWLPQDKILPAKKSKKLLQSSDSSSANIKIAGLNTKSALSLLGSEKLFWTVLKDYYLAIDKKIVKIQELMQSGRWRDYTIEVHSLKSTSKQIGADLVATLAAELERAGNEENISVINNKTDEMLMHYFKYKEILKPYFPDCSKVENDSYPDPEKLQEMLNKMLASVNDFDILEIDDAIDELSQYKYPDEQQIYLDEIKSAVEDSSLDKCKDIISRWRKVISISG